jgi:hypothetical protein
MAKDPNLQEINDSKLELSRQLRQALRENAAKRIDREHLNRLMECVRNALELVEDIELMVK